MTDENKNNLEGANGNINDIIYDMLKKIESKTDAINGKLSEHNSSIGVLDNTIKMFKSFMEQRIKAVDDMIIYFEKEIDLLKTKDIITNNDIEQLKTQFDRLANEMFGISPLGREPTISQKLHAIDTKINALIDKLDDMDNKLNKHEERIGHIEKSLLDFHIVKRYDGVFKFADRVKLALLSFRANFVKALSKLIFENLLVKLLLIIGTILISMPFAQTIINDVINFIRNLIN